MHKLRLNFKISKKGWKNELMMGFGWEKFIKNELRLKDRSQFYSV